MNVTLPALQDQSSKTAEQARILANRLRKRKRHLTKWARREGTGAYRLYDRDIPEIPLVLDYYAGTRNGKPVQALFGALYKRPYEKTFAAETDWLTAMRMAAAQAIEVDEQHIFLKERRRSTPSGQYQKQPAARESFIMEVREGGNLVKDGLIFTLNLSDYIDSGLFLDARRVRALVLSNAAGKTVLNLFCYTAAFSVYAAAGGAARVDSVDMSAAALKRAAGNFALNGQNSRNAPHHLIRADALRFLEHPENQRWDMIILNPPVFSHSKKMGNATLDTKRDCVTLLKRTLALLAPGGTLLFSAAARGQTLTGTAIASLKQSFPALNVTDITSQARSEDFLKHKIPSWWTLSLNH